MFRFFTREPQQRANAVIITTQLWTSMIEYKWQNKFFYETEDAEVSIASDLVKNSFLFPGEKRERLCSGQRLGHERPREVEPFFASDDIFNAPMNAFRRCERRLVCITIKHIGNTSYSSYM